MSAILAVRLSGVSHVADIFLVLAVSLIGIFLYTVHDQEGDRKALFKFAGKAYSEAKRKTALTQGNNVVKKGIILAIIAAIALGGYRLVMYYWYVLDSYFYIGEFYILFASHNLKSANLDIFKECLACMNPMSSGFLMVLYSHFVQNFWLPFTKQILPLAAIASYGLSVGSLFTYLSFLIVAIASFGLGVFFFGDIIPFIQSKVKRDYSTFLAQISVMPLAALMAIPYIPISFVGITGGAIRIPLKNVLILTALGVAVRAAWLIFLP